MDTARQLLGCILPQALVDPSSPILFFSDVFLQRCGFSYIFSLANFNLIILFLKFEIAPLIVSNSINPKEIWSDKDAFGVYTAVSTRHC